MRTRFPVPGVHAERVCSRVGRVEAATDPEPRRKRHRKDTKRDFHPSLTATAHTHRPGGVDSRTHVDHEAWSVKIAGTTPQEPGAGAIGRTAPLRPSSDPKSSPACPRTAPTPGADPPRHRRSRSTPTSSSRRPGTPARRRRQNAVDASDAIADRVGAVAANRFAPGAARHPGRAGHGSVRS